MTRTILTGATVVDGTGGAAREATVVIADGTIEAVLDPDAAEVGADDDVVDLAGLVLAPGFIDPHTHLDAQITWDPDLTPSSWHGVTTVVMGNCGFGIAPTRPADRETVVRTLENVEGMSAAALRAGVRWDFEGFGEYLALVDETPTRLNTAVMIGHTPLRLFAMGAAATEREATADEIDEMVALVREAVAAGAVGFATSRSANHQGAGGRPVPSRFASMEEVVALARAANSSGPRMVQLATGPGLREPDELAEFQRAVGGPVSWTALLADRGASGQAVQKLRETRASSSDLWAQIACRPIVTQTTFAAPTTFGMCPAFADVLALAPEARADCYRDPEWRDRARPQADAQWGHRWDETTIQESAGHPELVGVSVAELAAQRGVHPLDLMLDVALDDGLATRFRIVLLNDDDDEIARLLHTDGALLALSDAGAHASQLCDACYTTDLLGRWVRELGVLGIERAVWHLSGQPAVLFGLHDRGTIAAGKAADLVAFDPVRVAAGDLERVHDLPTGADRLIAPSVGIEHMWVNGVAVRRDGVDLADVRPGRLVAPQRGR